MVYSSSDVKTAPARSARASAPDSAERNATRALVAVIAAFVVISSLYSFFIPLFESQDEEAHFKYLKHLAVNMKLPDYRKMEDIDSADYESHQPPLYYFLQGMVLRLSGNKDIFIRFRENPIRSAGNQAKYIHLDLGEKFPYYGKYRVAHLLRFTNIIAGALILLLIYETLKLIFPAKSSTPLLAAAFVAFIPQFTYICATINNDPFLILFASLTIFFLLRFMSRADNASASLVCLSISLGLTILSKQLALFLVPVAYLAVLSKGDFRSKSKNILLLTGILFFLVGWFYLRNYLLFGDALNAKIKERELVPSLVQKKTLHQFYDYLSNFFFVFFLNSFWGSFGYMRIWMNPLIYLFYDVLLGVGLVSYAIALADPNFRNQFSRQRKVFCLLLALGLALLAVEILLFNMSYSQPQGRFAFPGLCPLAVFWGLGMERLMPGEKRRRNALTYSAIALFVFLNVFVLMGRVKKAFPSLPERIDVLQSAQDVNLGELTKDIVVKQTFHCNISGLDQIAVKLTTFNRYNNNHIIFRLREKYGPPHDLVTIRIPASSLLDDSFHFFRFPSQENSGGRDYCFLIESPDGGRSSAISCYATVSNSYPGGEASLNGHVLTGDLTFLTAGD